MQQRHGARRDQRRLPRRLGEHGIACGQRRRHLSGEDRERKIPRADAGHGAESAVRFGMKIARRLRGVVAQKIHRLAHFGQRIGRGLAAFAHHQRHQLQRLLLIGVGRTQQASRALGRGRFGPGRETGTRRGQRRLDLGHIGLLHLAHRLFAPRRVVHWPRRFAGSQWLCQQRRGVRGLLPREYRGKALQTGFIGQIPATRIGALRPEQRARQWNARMRRAHDLFAFGRGLDQIHGRAQQRIERHRGVGGLVHK